MNNLIDQARHLPAAEPVLTASYNRVSLAVPARDTPLEMRITAPVDGDRLPVILLSHGHGPSLYLPSKDGYGPMASFYAEQGFAVIQPTHANSKVAGLPADAPGAPLFWRERVAELVLILDELRAIEAQVPALAGRLDHDRIGAVGHSLGGQTVAMLLGARLTDPNDASAINVDLHDSRIKAGVLLAAPGKGGSDLSEMAARKYSFMNPNFATLTTRTLVVCGDHDDPSHLAKRGPDWFADPYHLSPGAECLLTLHGVGHGLGGIAGYDARETDKEVADILEATRRISTAYLRSALLGDDAAWAKARAALDGPVSAIGSIACKADPT